MSLGCNHLF